MSHSHRTLKLYWKKLNIPGQITTLPKPGLRTFSGDSITKPPFWRDLHSNPQKFAQLVLPNIFTFGLGTGRCCQGTKYQQG